MLRYLMILSCLMLLACQSESYQAIIEFHAPLTPSQDKALTSFLTEQSKSFTLKNSTRTRRWVVEYSLPSGQSEAEFLKKALALDFVRFAEKDAIMSIN